MADTSLMSSHDRAKAELAKAYTQRLVQTFCFLVFAMPALAFSAGFSVMIFNWLTEGMFK